MLEPKPEGADSATPAAPFAELRPDRILDAIDSLGQLRCDGRFLALNSYENRVYQVWLEDGSVIVAKFYRPARWSDEQILEEHAFSAELAAAEIPVVAPCLIAGHTLHSFEGYRFALFPRRGGRAPELEDAATLEWLGRFLGRIHAIGASRPFVHRPALDLASFGEASRDWLLEHAWVPADMLAPWRAVVDMALDGVRRAFARAGEIRTLRLHGDCHAGNVLWTPDGPHFVDFDDCRSGPAIQDLWMLLGAERELQQRQLLDILAGYEAFADFDARELQLIEALRTLRLLHYSAWIARRWQDPAFPAAFPWFNSARYWEARVLELREQVAAMDEAPLRV